MSILVRSRRGCTGLFAAAAWSFSRSLEGRGIVPPEGEVHSNRRPSTDIGRRHADVADEGNGQAIMGASSSFLRHLKTSPLLLPRLLTWHGQRGHGLHTARGGVGEERAANGATDAGAEVLDFPGALAPYVSQMAFTPERPVAAMPCFRVMNELGQVLEGADVEPVGPDLTLKMYTSMVTLQCMDVVFYEAQRQGRFSFHMTTMGEEAVNMASAAALEHSDQVFAQYREPGVLLWRGFTLQEFADQCLSNCRGHGKGRQMPIHYGSPQLNFHTISSPLATQIPHAVGAAYGLKARGEPSCAVTFFGEGAASEGDFHAAMNFAAVLEAPVLFICRNNGWAISTPAREQYRGDGIAGRGQSYGMRSLRVDGNDTLAIYTAVKRSRQLAVEEGQPILLELMTYRVGHHSTSDDSSRYRGAAEILHWKEKRDPVARFRRWVEGKGWWGEEQEATLRKEMREKVIAALNLAEAQPKPPLSALFTDVYDKVPPNLVEQERLLREAVTRNPTLYPADVPLS
eukprot:TRINITY_DN4493_c0_g1_i1.p1 TRINITY_DN4493_c0_g1~~TRINITY_DN4493_c0_g1_i1.p1  ORF type:complete len:514 (+),score=96.95 TRINITY_DN4493_c0_g1_i1:431-1972(+)